MKDDKAFEDVSRSPLSWPAWESRTPTPKRSQFGKHSVDFASRILLAELRRAGARDPLISTDLALRLDGLPRSGQKSPDDTGVAVYFELEGEPHALACDRWDRVEHNLWAIAKHVESLRGQDRWGVGSMRQAFAGYAALPEHATQSIFCWVAELGFDEIPGSFANARARYRIQSIACHPDNGGSQDDFNRLAKALQSAADFFGVDLRGKPLSSKPKP